MQSDLNNKAELHRDKEVKPVTTRRGPEVALCLGLRGPADPRPQPDGWTPTPTDRMATAAQAAPPLGPE